MSKRGRKGKKNVFSAASGTEGLPKLKVDQAFELPHASAESFRPIIEYIRSHISPTKWIRASGYQDNRIEAMET